MITEQLMEIAQRIRELREIMEVSEEQMAQSCGVTLEEYRAYERGEKDFSFSFFYNVANRLGVDVVDIMSGDSPKLSTCCLVRSGEGLEVNRREAYDYKHIAFTFRKKKAEPFVVTVEPKGEEETPELHAHAGQELNYMIEGSMAFYIGTQCYTLEAGDSVYFDSGIPHAMRALKNKRARFLAVVMK
nr:cupin domain-containing protein [Maliibacterium massiliense]